MGPFLENGLYLTRDHAHSGPQPKGRKIHQKGTVQFCIVHAPLGSFLYYLYLYDWHGNGAYFISHTLASEEVTLTKRILKRVPVKYILVYMATNLNSIVRFYAPDMMLDLHSGLSYFSEGQDKNRV